MAFLLHTHCRKAANLALNSPLAHFSRSQYSTVTTSQSSPFLKNRLFMRNHGVRRLLTTKNKHESEQGAKLSMSKVWERFLGPKPMPERWTTPWYIEMVRICTVFAITGSSTMVLVRPAVSSGLGLQGSLKDGPWSYRISSLVIMTPIYATLLVCVGTVFGRHHYFRHFSVKMWSRFGIPPEVLDKSFHETKKHFRKW